MKYAAQPPVSGESSACCWPATAEEIADALYQEMILHEVSVGVVEEDGSEAVRWFDGRVYRLDPATQRVDLQRPIASHEHYRPSLL